MMVTRRRFLFLLGGTATGIWFASTGLVRLELISGPRIFICDTCVADATAMVTAGLRTT